ncbi:MAG: DUF432 domain-containing protein [Gemmatimonadota bacterium]
MTSVETGELPPPWGEHTLPGDEPIALRLGPLTVWAALRAGEVWIAHVPGDWTRSRRGRPQVSGPDEALEGDAWVRWPVPEGTERIALSPAFPPRTLVAEPEHSFHLLPRARARIYVRVPLWVRVEMISTDRQALVELPSVLLSDTWWGSPTEGELSYWLQTTARRGVPPEVFEPHLAVCPLDLSNPSDDELTVERIALRVAYLSVFSDEGRLWSDETRLRYQGSDEGSRIDVSGRPPEQAPGAVRIAGPREPPPSRGFRARSFARLKAVSGLVGLE